MDGSGGKGDLVREHIPLRPLPFGRLSKKDGQNPREKPIMKGVPCSTVEPLSKKSVSA